VIGLVVGGVVVFVILIASVGAIVAKRAIDAITVVTPTTTFRPFGSTTSREPTTTRERQITPTGPTTTVPGTGPVTSFTNLGVGRLLQETLRPEHPGLSVGLALCPRAPYKVGHLMECRVLLQDAIVTYRVEVTGDDTIKAQATGPIVDTDEAEKRMEAAEPTGRASCGGPRIRQLEVGARLTCRTPSTTWDFTVTPAGELEGAPR